MKETPPGKTCVIGAGYVALECAGFITNLHQGEVVVLVRSMLLRGFDRDVVNRVKDVMVAQGTRIMEGVQPTSITKLPSGRLLVTYSTGASEEFDTVLCAIGRRADTSKLGLENVGITADPSNGKLKCANEQTSVSHIYAVGDVVQDAPELTPSAILAGKLLARRLFGNSDQLMDYQNIATTVFTPLELGTVGLTEEAAIEKYGAESVDCYLSEFTPLEWTVLDKGEKQKCFAKVVVNTKDNNKVLGMHVACPNAGEVIQGYAVAVKQGISHDVRYQFRRSYLCAQLIYYHYICFLILCAGYSLHRGHPPDQRRGVHHHDRDQVVGRRIRQVWMLRISLLGSSTACRTTAFEPSVSVNSTLKVALIETMAPKIVVKRMTGVRAA